ncbi:MAG: hypothetical protein HQ525_11645, partial [Anaerolineae bacterium]|nr:hypothetical protein [Anaerolineae bacterium]
MGKLHPPWEKEFYTQNINPFSDNFLGMGDYEYKAPNNDAASARFRTSNQYQENLQNDFMSPGNIMGRDDSPQIIGRDDSPQIIGRDDSPQIIGRDD